MDGGAWRATVHGITKSRTWLSDFTFTFHFHALEKEMATHSSVLAWRIPGMGKPGGLPSMGSHGAGHNWSDLAAALRHKTLLIECDAVIWIYHFQIINLGPKMTTLLSPQSKGHNTYWLVLLIYNFGHFLVCRLMSRGMGCMITNVPFLLSQV